MDHCTDQSSSNIPTLSEELQLAVLTKHTQNTRLKMDHYTDQSSSNIPTHSDELQLAVLKQQNTLLTYEILPLKLKKTINTKMS